MTIKAILFDLDGTLLDTVPDLLHTLNLMRLAQGMDELHVSQIRPYVNSGSKTLLSIGLNKAATSDFSLLREKFFELYEHHLGKHSHFFPDMDPLLNQLEHRGIPWGIVTNKITQHTQLLLAALKIDHRPACVICGDTLSTSKPNPEPILHACSLLKHDPQQCLFIGDDAVDVLASKAAGTKSLVALYGYIHEDPYTWDADGYINNPLEILDWLQDGRQQN